MTIISFTFGQTHTINKQKKSSYTFYLSLSTFNHTELLFHGVTIYKLTNKFIKVINIPFGEKKGKVIFYKSFSDSQDSSAIINNFGLDSLEDFYYNYCVVATSGDEYTLNYQGYSKKKSIDLHCYYLKQIDDIVNLINSYLPFSYQINYVKKDEKQNCSL